MSLTKIGSIGINTGIQFAGVTTVSTLHVGSGVTLSSDGDVFATGISTFSEDIKVGSGVTISPDGDGFYTGVVTATSFVGDGANLTNVDVVSDTSPQLGGNLDVNTKNIVFGDSGGSTDDRLTFGAGTDLSIYHNGSNSYIDDSGTGNLFIRSNEVRINKYTNEYMIRAIADGAVELYHNNERKIYTHATGIQVEDATSTGASIVMSTSSGTSGSLYATGDNTLGLLDGQNHYMLKGVKDGALELYYDNAKKLETSASGIKLNGVENAGAQLMIGAGDDIQIEHDGSGSAFKNSTGILYVQSDDLRLTSKTGGQLMFKGTYTGAAELYNANARKLSTAAGGLEFFGRSVDCQVNFNNADNSTRYGGVYGYTESGVDIMAFLKSDGNYSLVVNDNGEVRTYGHVRPNADNSYDLGTSTHRWRNLYTTDLQLSNEGKTNDVDGTWGDYTIQEGESDLFLINNRSGKKYKFNLTEVS